MAMDLLWYRRYRADGGDQPFAAWEFSTSAESFEDAPAPAKVGQRIAGAFGVELPNSSVSATNSIVHWSTGLGWGKLGALASRGVAGAAHPRRRAHRTRRVGHVLRHARDVGIYQPITSYDNEVLWKDLTAHLVFGSVLGLVLTPRRRSRR